MELEALIEILELSVEKNGERPLTNRWLLNICKVTMRKITEEDQPYNIGDDPNE